MKLLLLQPHLMLLYLIILRISRSEQGRITKTINCRRYIFAPQCRGISAKRDDENFAKTIIKPNLELKRNNGSADGIQQKLPAPSVYIMAKEKLQDEDVKLKSVHAPILEKQIVKNRLIPVLLGSVIDLDDDG